MYYTQPQCRTFHIHGGNSQAKSTQKQHRSRKQYIRQTDIQQQQKKHRNNKTVKANAVTCQHQLHKANVTNLPSVHPPYSYSLSPIVVLLSSYTLPPSLPPYLRPSLLLQHLPIPKPEIQPHSNEQKPTQRCRPILVMIPNGPPLADFIHTP